MTTRLAPCSCPCRRAEAPREQVEADIDRALKVIPATKWRIPWGHLAPYTQEVAAERSLTIVGWDADTHDWRGDSAEHMLAQLRLEPGGIVLAHDGVGDGARRQTAIETARLVRPLVQQARAQGLDPGPLRDPWPVPLPLGNPNFAA